MEFNRIVTSSLNLNNSILLFGPRQTGKSSIIKNQPLIRLVDLLSIEEFLKFNKNPDLLFQEISSLKDKSGTIAIDEIQKIPLLLDVVHRLIETYKELKFILTGSSARKLKLGVANLLGGRAIDLKLHPLSFFELGDNFSLDLALQYGTLPKIYTLLLNNEYTLVTELLHSYVSTYLNEEIKSEALVRNLPGFQRFLDVAASCFGRQINLSDMALHAGIADQTVRDYYSILEDTLIGYFLQPFHLSARKRLSTPPKFYFFDNGVTRAVLGSASIPPSNQEKGYLFVQFVVQEVIRTNDYYRKFLKIYFWRTSSGSEVDLIIVRGTQPVLAIECKASTVVTRSDMSSLVSLPREFGKIPKIICAPVNHTRKEKDGILVLPPKEVLELVRDI